MKNDPSQQNELGPLTLGSVLLSLLDPSGQSTQTFTTHFMNAMARKRALASGNSAQPTDPNQKPVTPTTAPSAGSFSVASPLADLVPATPAPSAAAAVPAGQANPFPVAPPNPLMPGNQGNLDSSPDPLATPSQGLATSSPPQATWPTAKSGSQPLYAGGWHKWDASTDGQDIHATGLGTTFGTWDLKHPDAGDNSRSAFDDSFIGPDRQGVALPTGKAFGTNGSPFPTKLPPGTMVKVYNRRTGRSAIVPYIDEGPTYTDQADTRKFGSAMIDIAPGTAKALGMDNDDHSTDPVDIRIVGGAKFLQPDNYQGPSYDPTDAHPDDASVLQQMGKMLPSIGNNGRPPYNVGPVQKLLPTIQSGSLLSTDLLKRFDGHLETAENEGDPDPKTGKVPNAADARREYANANAIYQQMVAKYQTALRSQSPKQTPPTPVPWPTAAAKDLTGIDTSQPEGSNGQVPQPPQSVPPSVPAPAQIPGISPEVYHVAQSIPFDDIGSDEDVWGKAGSPNINRLSQILAAAKGQNTPQVGLALKAALPDLRTYLANDNRNDSLDPQIRRLITLYGNALGSQP